jgi:hypothetical protein
MSDKIDLLALHLVGGRLTDEPSHALERHKYGDPARHVKFASEQSGGLMQETLGTKEIESILRHEIDNWIRWGKKRDWKPVGFRCPLGHMHKATDVHEVSARPLPCNEMSAAGFERLIIGLPDRHRQAFVMHHLDKAHVAGHIRILKGRDEGARLLGVQVRQYHYMIQQAHSMVLREWRKVMAAEM